MYREAPGLRKSLRAWLCCPLLRETFPDKLMSHWCPLTVGLTSGQLFFFFLNFGFIYLFIYLFIYFFIFIYGCVGSLPLCEGFLQLQQVGATPHRGARAPHHRGLSCCGAQAPDAQTQQLWLTGPAAPRQMGSSQTRAQTRVPCIGRQTLNHCATREALGNF